MGNLRMCLLRTMFLLVAFAVLESSLAKENEKPTFDVTSSRSMEEAPTIKVTFANGVKDQLDLTHYKMHEDSEIGCNYIGHLRNSPSSSVAVTGCINKPGDRMEMTIISEHNTNKMFTVDFNGNAEIIKNPFEEGATSRALLFNRKFNHIKWDDEIFDDAEEERASTAQLTNIPSELKAVIRFGYDDTMLDALNGLSFDSWIASVFTHTQAYFRHAASLGTSIEFEVQGSSIHHSGVKWTADDDIYNAKAATNALSLDGVDTMSWWCDDGGGSTAGIAFVGALCDDHAVTLSEKQPEAAGGIAGSGFVLAHELGHNFGMSHDFASKHGGVDGPCNNKGIMSYGHYDFEQWSTCSRLDWEQHYAEENWGNGCLEDMSGTATTQGPTEPPGPTVCFDVTTVTTAFANENSWAIACVDRSCSECVSDSQSYRDDSQYTQNCCLPQDREQLLVICKDSWGDGWEGGYLEINGNKFCKDYTTGLEKEVIIDNEGFKPPEDLCIENNGGCDQICTNDYSRQTVVCSCNEGFTLKKDEKACTVCRDMPKWCEIMDKTSDCCAETVKKACPRLCGICVDAKMFY